MKTAQFGVQKRRILEGYSAGPEEEEEHEFQSSCLVDNFDTACFGFVFFSFHLEKISSGTQKFSIRSTF